jgi:Protein of unknown function (DUF3500)
VSPAADAMTRAASALPPRTHRDFADPARTRWSYLPGHRPGVSLGELGAQARKAAHRLLASALSRHAFAQAVTIMAFEEVLDLDEGGQVGRHSDGYYVSVFGTPGDGDWAWRFEGHHLSVNVTITGGQPVIAPLFLGANPAQVRYNGERVLAPLAHEEDLARTIVTGLAPGKRDSAIIAGRAPADIATGIDAAAGRLEPAGIRAAALPDPARGQLARLLGMYLDRLTPELASAELALIPPGEVTFAWAGGILPGEGHYYRIQAPGLLVEYDNTQRHACHAHTVLRKPGRDFAADLLASHISAERRV